jgi:signal transduction histidine kinase
VKGGAKSLWIQLGLALVASSLVAIAVASVILYVRFKATNSTFSEHTLRNETHIIGKYLRRVHDDGPLTLPPDLLQAFQEASGKYAIVDEKGAVLAGSSGVTAPLSAIDPNQPLDYFALQGQAGGPLYGLSSAAELRGKRVWVQVAFVASDILFDSVLQDFLEDVAWIWIPFVGVLIVVNLAVTRIGLRRLRAAARQAARIGPADFSARLPEQGLPGEVLALVSAINMALDRLQGELNLQRGFIADAAHELRTPVSVLKAHVGILPASSESDQLRGEVRTLERLVNQLLDSARIETIRLNSQTKADLTKIAKDVVSHLAPIAIERGRSLEVVSNGTPVIIRGDEDSLFRAVRNVVENALQHTRPKTIVTVTVGLPATLQVEDHGPGVPNDQRELIFQRFWQGKRDKGAGAGLGMDIVQRTVAAHGGSITVDDAPQGGALFTLCFPMLATTDTVDSL